MAHKFWWLDDSDRWEAEQKLAVVKSQFSDREWIRFEDGDPPEEYHRKLAWQLESCAMFAPGKVVYCYGVPGFQAELAENLKIANGVVFVLIAKPDKSLLLYKKVRKMVEEKTAKIDELGPLGRGAAKQWIQERAHALCLKIDDSACQEIVDLFGSEHGLDRNRMCQELLKLKHFVSEGPAAAWAVQQVAYGVGEADVKLMCEAILAGNSSKANAHLESLIARGEPGLKICGYLMDWLRKLKIAEDCANMGQMDALKPLLGQIKKRPKEKDKGEEPGPMFPNLGVFYWAYKGWSESGRGRGWAEKAMHSLSRLQIELRVSKPYVLDDGEVLLPAKGREAWRMHEFVSLLAMRRTSCPEKK